jgi:hypothetical protein
MLNNGRFTTFNVAKCRFDNNCGHYVTLEDKKWRLFESVNVAKWWFNDINVIKCSIMSGSGHSFTFNDENWRLYVIVNVKQWCLMTLMLLNVG